MASTHSGRWFYAPCRLGRSGGSGYQTFTHSQDVTVPEREELARVTNFMARLEGHEEMHALGWTPLASGRYALFHAGQGLDDTGRNSYYAEAHLVDSAGDVWPTPCAGVAGVRMGKGEPFREPLSQTELQLTTIPDLLTPETPDDRGCLRLPLKMPPFDLGHYLVNHTQRVIQLLEVVFPPERHIDEDMPRVLVVGSADDAVAVFTLLWHCASEEERKKMSFCSLLSETNTTPFTVAGRLPSLGRPNQSLLSRFRTMFAWSGSEAQEKYEPCMRPDVSNRVIKLVQEFCEPAVAASLLARIQIEHDLLAGWRFLRKPFPTDLHEASRFFKQADAEMLQQAVKRCEGPVAKHCCELLKGNPDLIPGREALERLRDAFGRRAPKELTEHLAFLGWLDRFRQNQIWPDEWFKELGSGIKLDPSAVRRVIAADNVGSLYLLECLERSVQSARSPQLDADLTGILRRAWANIPGLAAETGRLFCDWDPSFAKAFLKQLGEPVQMPDFSDEFVATVIGEGKKGRGTPLERLVNSPWGEWVDLYLDKTSGDVLKFRRPLLMHLQGAQPAIKVADWTWLFKRLSVADILSSKLGTEGIAEALIHRGAESITKDEAAEIKKWLAKSSNIQVPTTIISALSEVLRPYLPDEPDASAVTQASVDDQRQRQANAGRVLEDIKNADKPSGKPGVVVVGDFSESSYGSGRIQENKVRPKSRNEDPGYTELNVTPPPSSAAGPSDTQPQPQHVPRHSTEGESLQDKGQQTYQRTETGQSHDDKKAYEVGPARQRPQSDKGEAAHSGQGRNDPWWKSSLTRDVAVAVGMAAFVILVVSVAVEVISPGFILDCFVTKPDAVPTKPEDTSTKPDLIDRHIGNKKYVEAIKAWHDTYGKSGTLQDQKAKDQAKKLKAATGYFSEKEFTDGMGPDAKKKWNTDELKNYQELLGVDRTGKFNAVTQNEVIVEQENRQILPRTGLLTGRLVELLNIEKTKQESAEKVKQESKDPVSAAATETPAPVTKAPEQTPTTMAGEVKPPDQPVNAPPPDRQDSGTSQPGQPGLVVHGAPLGSKTGGATTIPGPAPAEIQLRAITPVNPSQVAIGSSSTPGAGMAGGAAPSLSAPAFTFEQIRSAGNYDAWTKEGGFVNQAKLSKFNEDLARVFREESNRLLAGEGFAMGDFLPTVDLVCSKLGGDQSSLKRKLRDGLCLAIEERIMRLAKERKLQRLLADAVPMNATFKSEALQEWKLTEGAKWVLDACLAYQKVEGFAWKDVSGEPPSQTGLGKEDPFVLFARTGKAMAEEDWDKANESLKKVQPPEVAGTSPWPEMRANVNAGLNVKYWLRESELAAGAESIMSLQRQVGLKDKAVDGQMGDGTREAIKKMLGEKLVEQKVKDFQNDPEGLFKWVAEQLALVNKVKIEKEKGDKDKKANGKPK